MPVMPIYFQALSPQQANPLGYGMAQGTQIVNNMLAGRGQELQNQMLSAQIPYAGDMAQASLAMKQAQVPYVESQTAMNLGMLPYLGMKYYAPLLQAQARMAQVGISNSNAFRSWTQTPEGASFVANNPEMAQTIANAMNNSASMINSGFPGGGSPAGIPQTGNYNNPASYPVLPGATPTTTTATPITQTQTNQLKNLLQPQIPAIQDAAALQSLHKTTDAAARQKNLYATNIDKTLQQIDPDALTQYAGSFGTAEKVSQAGLASIGMESKNYDNYMKSLNAANMLATQVRQFYGDSIQPSMIHRLEQLTQPSTWSTNPKLAKDLFNETKQILTNETGTYRQAMQNTAPYLGTPQQPVVQASPAKAAAPQAPSAQSARVRVISPAGKVGSIPANQLQAALQAGFKQG